MQGFSAKVQTWFTNFDVDGDASTRLICFPFSGGGANVYRPWVSRIHDTEIVALSMPGRENRFAESARDNLDSMIREIAPLAVQLMDKPCVFYGHSMGALIAFELARSLQSNYGKIPLKLIVSAYRSPERPNPNTIMHVLDDEQFVAELHRYGGTAQEILDDEITMDFITPMLRADFKLHETHRLQRGVKLDCPVSAFCATRDHLVNVDQMSGWSSYTTSSFSMRQIAGDHFYIKSTPEIVFKALNHEMAQSWTRQAMVMA